MSIHEQERPPPKRQRNDVVESVKGSRFEESSERLLRETLLPDGHYECCCTVLKGETVGTLF